MKQIFLTITLFSILAIIPISIFAQSSQPQGDPDALLGDMSAQFTAKKYAEAIETASKALSYSFKTPAKKVLAFEIRATSLNNLYFLKGKTIYTDYTFKYSPETVEKLKLAVSDYGEVINYYKQNPATNENVENSRNSVYSTSANIYWSLGKYSSHNPDDFAKAEELFKLALPKSKNPNWINFRLVLCLAGQYKFYDARELAKRVLAAETEEDYRATLSNIVEAFDSMGEYHFAEAFLVEIAGIRKTSNKSLKPIGEVNIGRRAAQNAALGFSNPTTAMELNRKGVLFLAMQGCGKAMAIFEKSLSISETSTAARYGVQCLFEQNKYEDAWQISNNLLDFDKNDVVALSYRGILNGMQNDEVKAEADISKAISVFPELAAYYNALDNSKKIYQSQNKTQKVNEIAAMEKKFAELDGEITKAGEKDGIGDILDEDDKNEKKPTPKPTPTPTSPPVPKITNEDLDGDGVPDSEDVCPSDKGSKANKGCPSKNEPTPTPNTIPVSKPKYETVSTAHRGLSDCQFIIDDSGCRKFYGKSIVELNAIFGETPKNGSYSNLGIWFYMWSPSRDKAETVAQVKFYGKDIGDGTRFSGKPGKNLDWNASPSDVIKIYGKPASQSEWTNSDKTVESAMGYGGDLSMRFENEKLVEITLTNPKYIEESDAYLEKEKQKYLEEKKAAESRIVQEKAKETAKNEANQMEADYKSLLNQLDAKLREGERIVNSEKLAIAAGGMFKNAVQKKLDKVRAAGDSLIDSFGKKYQGKIPAWMVKGIKDKWRPD